MLEEVNIASWIELRRYICQTPNEVLNGLTIDYEAQLHSPRSRIAMLPPKLDMASTERMLSSEDAVLLLRISHLCEEEELGEQEFFTRAGYTFSEARQVDARLEKAAAAVAPERTHASVS